MAARGLGWACMIIGIVVMALTLWVLFAPPPMVALPTLIIGVGSLASVVIVVIGLSSSR